jgi:hypothetical protein
VSLLPLALIAPSGAAQKTAIGHPGWFAIRVKTLMILRTLRGAAIQIAAADIAVSSDHMARACAEKLVQAATP